MGILNCLSRRPSTSSNSSGPSTNGTNSSDGVRGRFKGAFKAAITKCQNCTETVLSMSPKAWFIVGGGLMIGGLAVTALNPILGGIMCTSGIVCIAIGAYKKAHPSPEPTAVPV